MFQLLWQFAGFAIPYALFSPVMTMINSFWVLSWRMCLMRSYLSAWSDKAASVEGAAQARCRDPPSTDGEG